MKLLLSQRGRHSGGELAGIEILWAKKVLTSEAEEILKRLARWDVITNNTETVFAAIELHKKYKFSFWDSLIIASALEGGARTLLSEDLSDKQKLEGIVITNPFKA